MILFALAIEPLLRLLEELISDKEFVGCFADDVGMVVRNLRSKLRPLYDLFEKFRRASGMELNLSKCVCVPLSAHPDCINNPDGH